MDKGGTPECQKPRAPVQRFLEPHTGTEISVVAFHIGSIRLGIAKAARYYLNLQHPSVKSASREARMSLGNPDVYVVASRNWAPRTTDERRDWRHDYMGSEALQMAIAARLRGVLISKIIEHSKRVCNIL